MNVLPGLGGVYIGPLGTELYPAVNESDRGAELGEKEGGLEGAVAAAYHRYGFFPEKSPITGSAIADSPAHIIVLALQPQLAVLGPGTEDQGAAFILLLPGGETKALCGLFRPGDLAVLHF